MTFLTHFKTKCLLVGSILSFSRTLIDDMSLTTWCQRICENTGIYGLPSSVSRKHWPAENTPRFKQTIFIDRSQVPKSHMLAYDMYDKQNRFHINKESQKNSYKNVFTKAEIFGSVCFSAMLDYAHNSNDLKNNTHSVIDLYY